MRILDEASTRLTKHNKPRHFCFHVVFLGTILDGSLQHINSLYTFQQCVIWTTAFLSVYMFI
jgi:hypothetical protein